MKRNYISPRIKAITVSSILCANSPLNLPVNETSEENGVADANGRRTQWGNLWGDEE